MIYYEENDIDILFDIIESLAAKIAHYRHPYAHSVSEEEIAQIIREEGLPCFLENKKE